MVENLTSFYDLPTRDQVRAAYQRIAGHVRVTPVIEIQCAGIPVHLKLEQLQHTGSFKARGAFNAMLRRGPLPQSGVIAASGGNHGLAVAYAAQQLGHRAEIFVPDIVSPTKRAAFQSLGAKLTIAGHEFAEALEACQLRQAETGALLLHAYDQPEVLEGQATVGLEFQQQAPQLDTLVIATGGGGLIGGISSWYRGDVKIISVEGQGTNALSAALSAGKPVDIEVSGVTADALGARRIGNLAYSAASEWVDQALVVSDQHIRAAQQWLWSALRVVAEPAGATALAAILSGAYVPDEREVMGVLICGGNADLSAFSLG